MFFFISKFIAFLIKPLGLLLLLTNSLLLIKNRTKTKRIKILILVLILIFCCPVFVDQLLKLYEPKPIAINKLQIADYGVVLTGGIMNESMSYEGNIILGDQGDRIWQTLRLYRAGKIKTIIISGGDGLSDNIKIKEYENDKCRDFLILNGVKATDIFQEKASRNTYENALFTAKLINSINKNASVTLITSGFHLKRAQACFLKQKIKTQGFGSSYMATNLALRPIDFVPTAVAFRKTDLIYNEIIGLITYWIVGYT
jgi:uncharacterized SAM-binding protein YcdF (DUF218 family)